MSRVKGSPKTGGKPKGYKAPATLSKEQAREALRTIVLREMDELVGAQVANAKGLQYLVARNVKTGKFERVTSAMLDAADDKMHERIEVWEKDPSVQAFSDLMDRALDKAAGQLQKLEISGEVALVARLQSARTRLAKHSKS